MQDGRRAHLEERVTQPFLRHVERHLGVEHPHVEREQAIQVLGEKGEVVNAVDQAHRARTRSSQS
jgi:cytochrome c peroxidase